MTEQCSKEPLMVTIRCITYNHEPYIRQCLEGFVMQKTNFRFEAIVHDDASTDGTADIIREFADKYPGIIKPIFETENQYSKHDGSIRRIMDAHTHGKYVAICEGDDYWTDPLKLQKQVDFMEENPEYMLIGGNAEVRTCDNIFLKKFALLESREVKAEEIINEWTFPTAGMLYRSIITNHIPHIKDAPQGDILIQMTCANLGRCYFDKDVVCVYRWLVSGSSTARVRKNQLNYYQRHYSMWVELNEYFGDVYNEAIQKKLKEINLRIIREKLFNVIPGLQALRSFYRYLRGY